MYVCVCNGIREKQVRKAVNDGAATVGRVFKAHGCKPECAQCVNCMRNVIEQESSQDTTLLAAE
ncbi:(2Fe-2S)-binding protein [Terasakiella sp. A23]|uniref:(2Fe-2S)-binding protein n=1 Tax=Terasakiella sp. FCG-A23 TaxID=3080561 RepID=UPI0029535BC1|nr:(2Fe-2S)-binding protein [Terasakiella sp. A23]MDV7340245.1 (2Fe-2S)-binding protein [Terasakiella sp. A23]